MMKKNLYLKLDFYDTMNVDIKYYLEKYKDKGTEVDVLSMLRSPKHLESLYYQNLASYEILKAVKRNENSCYDAVVIGFFNNPSLYTAREICEKMIVTGPGISAMQIATILGGSFSIIVGRDKWNSQMKDNILKNGFSVKLASFRSLELGILEFHDNPSFTIQRM